MLTQRLGGGGGATKMADGDNEANLVSTKKNVKKKGLPPMSPRSSELNGDAEIKKVKRKIKKKLPNTENQSTEPNKPHDSDADEGDPAENKPTPRRRRKRSPSQAKATDDEITSPASATATPRKKKKKPKAEKTDEIRTQSPSVGDQLNNKDSQGSKTSLISKDETTPRKKTARKKKKVKKVEEGVDEFGDTPWADDLRTMRDDIIIGDGEKKTEELGEVIEEKKQPLTTFFTTPILRSQPVDKIFIETSSKFKGQSKSSLARQRMEETVKPMEPVSFPRTTTIDFALASHKIFRVVTLFLHGLTAGLSLWQMVTVFSLSSFSSDDFLLHYYRVSMPLQCSYYFLLIVCTVSVCDRFDIGNPTRRFVLRALTLQNGAVAIVFSLVALILNIVAIRYDDKMYLYKEFKDLYTDDNTKAEDITMFQSINTARSVFIMLTWFVLSITPNSDRLGKNLKSGKTGLEKGLEMDRVSTA
ncbi:unnamed protein product [Lymnaea stagnalis]|uniref:Transmembrane protein 237 n=1 Tax=Lymnaea stagnalis TaxID=6523 RepID=A0AAV2IMH7_LYMST